MTGSYARGSLDFERGMSQEDNPYTRLEPIKRAWWFRGFRVAKRFWGGRPPHAADRAQPAEVRHG